MKSKTCLCRISEKNAIGPELNVVGCCGVKRAADIEHGGAPEEPTGRIHQEKICRAEICRGLNRAKDI